MLLTSVLIVAATCCLAALVTRLLGRNAGFVLALPLLVAAGMLITAFAQGVTEQVVPWMPELGINLALRLDGLAFLFAMLVTVIGAGTLCYASRYLQRDGKHGSFYVLMTAFALAMLLLVLADDLVLLYVAWEATTVCSFLLIARSGPHAREPAIRTLLVTVAGGLTLLAAVATMVVATGSTRLAEVLAHPFWHEQPELVTVVAVLLAVSAFTKSAQFPFQAWLPDSMVAITPVSAYLHAAAMVKAGIYLLLRFAPVLAGQQVWLTMLVISGLFTALFGAVAALRRNDLKELLAYSTMSQLGLLVTMIGVGTELALTAAVVHTVAHALFKSSLFMLIGVIDHQAGTRDITKLRHLRLRMPVLRVVLPLAAASMAGVPLLLGFVSKELMLDGFLHAPNGLLAAVVVLGSAVTSVFTFAYSARIVLGAFAGREGEEVREATPLFWFVPALAAGASLVLGIVPAPLTPLVTEAATAAVGAHVHPHLALWHGFTPALGVSAAIITCGVLLVLARRPVERFMAPRSLPISGLAVVDALRAGIIRFGGHVGKLSGTRALRLHLATPAVCLGLIGVLGAFTLPPLSAKFGSPSQPLDAVLLALMFAGTVGAVIARTRLAAIVVVGVVGFSMTLWFFILGAADVALTQLLVEILTVCVMVLLLRRLPGTFRRERPRNQIAPVIVAVIAGVATTAGVLVFTGRRDLSAAANYFLNEGAAAAGGSNLVNAILVEFRALDTLGELTVLGVAGIAIATLLHSRASAPTRIIPMAAGSPIADPYENSMYARIATRIAGPVFLAFSLYLLLRGHNDPGGGFIAALVGGGGLALVFLSRPTDELLDKRWPYLLLIGSGITTGTAVGLVGFVEGSFLKPLNIDLLGVHLTTALIFDIGVYFAVIGVVLASFNLLGGSTAVVADLDYQAPKAVHHR